MTAARYPLSVIMMLCQPDRIEPPLVHVLDLTEQLGIQRGEIERGTRWVTESQQVAEPDCGCHETPFSCTCRASWSSLHQFGGAQPQRHSPLLQSRLTLPIPSTAPFDTRYYVVTKEPWLTLHVLALSPSLPRRQTLSLHQKFGRLATAFPHTSTRGKC